ncbi:MAG: hypothetical protein M1819_000277 [Sarea resinae]|nr:MAG: hypothetical protein M1819_000277 [Sarea resinae]
MPIFNLTFLMLLLVALTLTHALPSLSPAPTSPEQQKRNGLLSLRAKLLPFQNPLHTTLLMAPHATAIPATGPAVAVAKAEAEVETETNRKTKTRWRVGGEADGSTDANENVHANAKADRKVEDPSPEAEEMALRARAAHTATLDLMIANRWADHDLDTWD